MDKDILDVLERYKAGEITKEQAAKEIQKNESSNKQAHKTNKKRKKGRPKKQEREDNYRIILTYWTAFGDGQFIDKMELKWILADALKVDISYISKVTAKMNRMVNNGYYFLKYEIDGELVLVFMSPEEFARFNLARLFGASPFKSVSFHTWRFPST